MPLAAAGEYPAVLSLKEQAAVYDGWLSVRLEKVLPELMRREKIDMWLVICREYNEDPVYLSLVPFASLSARRLSMLVMFDRGGDKGVERFSVSRYGIGSSFPTVWKAGEEDQWQALAKAIKERDPQRIGIDESDVFAFGDGLSASLKKHLVQALGPEILEKTRRGGAAGRGLARAPAARGDRGLRPHLLHRPRRHRRGLLLRRHHAGGHDDRRRRVVDLGEIPRPRPDDLVQSRHLHPAAQSQPL